METSCLPVQRAIHGSELPWPVQEDPLQPRNDAVQPGHAVIELDEGFDESPRGKPNDGGFRRLLRVFCWGWCRIRRVLSVICSRLRMADSTSPERQRAGRDERGDDQSGGGECHKEELCDGPEGGAERARPAP
jgi:hypothetical protein